MERRRGRLENRVLGAPYYQAKAALSLPDIPRLNVRKTVQFTYDISNDGYTYMEAAFSFTAPTNPDKFCVVLGYSVASVNDVGATIAQAKNVAGNVIWDHILGFSNHSGTYGSGSGTAVNITNNGFSTPLGWDYSGSHRVLVPPGGSFLSFGGRCHYVICESLGLALRALGS